MWEPVLEEDYSPESRESLTISLAEIDDNRPYATIKIYGMPAKGLLDSGSQLTLISEEVYQKLKCKNLQPLSRPTKITSANGTELTALGRLSIPFNFQGVMKIVPTIVVRQLTVSCILGMDFWRRFHIWPTVQSCSLVTLTEGPPPVKSSSPLTELEQAQIQYDP